MVIDLQRYWGEREIYWPAELSAKIIDSMQRNNSVILRSKESRCPEVSGLYNLLDQLCRYWNWNPAKITLESSNLLIEPHPRYNVIKCMYAGDDIGGMILNNLDRCQATPWNQEKIYGMFMGRANVTRIRGVHNHHNFEYRDQGLTSFHHDLKWHINESVLNEYLMSSDQRYSEITSIPPYSDIDQIIPPPITGKKTLLDWGPVYEKIGIELVFETSEISSNFDQTEKLMRPILYKRPFFLISGKHIVNKIKNAKAMSNISGNGIPLPALGVIDHELIREINEYNKTYRFFENAISTEYDNDEGIHRVDHVFDILRELIKTKKIYSVIDQCQEDIEHNYNVLMHTLPRLHELHKQTACLFDYESWKKPNYK